MCKERRTAPERPRARHYTHLQRCLRTQRTPKHFVELKLQNTNRLLRFATTTLCLGVGLCSALMGDCEGPRTSVTCERDDTVLLAQCVERAMRLCRHLFRLRTFTQIRLLLHTPAFCVSQQL